MNSFFKSQYNTGFYTKEELQDFGFISVGKNVLISRNAKIYGVSNISIGDYVRIDDFVILSGKINIGDFVHIGAGSIITGSDVGVIIKDFVSISNYVRILSANDDYTGSSLANPCIPNKYKNVTKKQIILEKHSMIGSGSLILPNSYIAEGVTIGGMSMIIRKTNPWGIYFGIPAKRIKNKQKDALELEKQFLKNFNNIRNNKTGGGGSRSKKLKKYPFLQNNPTYTPGYIKEVL